MTDSPRRLRVFDITTEDAPHVIRFFDVDLRELTRGRIELVGVTASRAFHEPLWKTVRRGF